LLAAAPAPELESAHKNLSALRNVGELRVVVCQEETARFVGIDVAIHCRRRKEAIRIERVDRHEDRLASHALREALDHRRPIHDGPFDRRDVDSRPQRTRLRDPDLARQRCLGEDPRAGEPGL
jgi:hypothetical protein